MKLITQDSANQSGINGTPNDIRQIQKKLRALGCNYQIDHVSRVIDAIQSGLPKSTYRDQPFDVRMIIPAIDYLGVSYPGINMHNVNLDGNCSIYYPIPELTVSDITTNGMVGAYIEEERRKVRTKTTRALRQKQQHKHARENAKTISNLSNPEEAISFLLKNSYIDNNFLLDGINGKYINAKDVNIFRASKSGIHSPMQPIHWKMVEKLNELGICVIDFDEFMKKKKGLDGKYLPFSFLSGSTNIPPEINQYGDISISQFIIRRY